MGGEHELTDLWPPNAAENLSICVHRRCGQIAALEACLAVSELLVEDLIAQAHLRCAFQAPQVPVVGKLFFEAKRTLFDLTLDDFKAPASSTKIRFRGRAFDRRTVSSAIWDEVKLNPPARRRGDSAREPLAAHVPGLLFGAVAELSCS
jgi:hypothetical protein